MKHLYVLLLILIFIACTVDQGVNFHDQNLSETKELATQQEKMIMVDFWSDG